MLDSILHIQSVSSLLNVLSCFLLHSAWPFFVRNLKVVVLETCFLILNLHGGDQKMPISFKDNITRQPADQSFALDC